MTTIADIVKAVMTELNNHAFSLPFIASRMYWPAFDLEDMTDLRVTVVPRSMQLTTVGRGLTQREVQIDIGIQKKLKTCDNAEIDDLMALVQEIAEFVRSTSRFDNAVWVKTENTPIYSQEHLGELRQFTSVLTLTLWVME